DDNIAEGSETVNLTLTNPTNGTVLGTPSQAVLTILDNDLPVPVVAQHTTITGVEGLPLSALVATFVDTNGPNAAVYSATIDWGDGSASSPGTITPVNGTFTVRGNHIYAEEGTYAVTVNIDETGEGTAIVVS